MRHSSLIALLRGINVGGNRKLPMAELRSICTDLGWTDVQSYIQSGNLIFRSSAEPARLETDLEKAIEHRFGFSVAVLVRAGEELPGYVAGNPFPDESERQPNRVMLALSKRPPNAGAVDELERRATAGERVVQVGDAIWIHYPGGSGPSKLSPGLLDRVTGSPVTTRNWRTVLKLQEMIRAADS
jgi:uncharacterized protein (DUF1697 family)